MCLLISEGGGGTPCSELHREGLPENGTFLHLQYTKG